MEEADEDHCSRLLPRKCVSECCVKYKWCTLTTVGLVCSTIIFSMSLAAIFTPWFTRIEYVDSEHCRRVISTGWTYETCFDTCESTSFFSCNGLKRVRWKEHHNCAAFNTTNRERISRSPTVAHISTTCALESHIFNTTYYLSVLSLLCAFCAFVYYLALWSLANCSCRIQWCTLSNRVERCRNSIFHVLVALVGVSFQCVAVFYFGGALPLTDMCGNSLGPPAFSVSFFGSSKTEYGRLKWGGVGWIVAAVSLPLYSWLCVSVCISSILLLSPLSSTSVHANDGSLTAPLLSRPPDIHGGSSRSVSDDTDAFHFDGAL